MEFSEQKNTEILALKAKLEKAQASEQALKEKVRTLEEETRNLRRKLKESEKTNQEKDAEIAKDQKRITKLNSDLENLTGQLEIKTTDLEQMTRDNERLRTELESVKEDLTKKTAQTNRDYTCSSKTSSFSPNHKTIQNGREKTGRSPGAQVGHPHWGRRILEPTRSDIHLKPPPEVLENPDRYQCTRQIVKQLQDICFEVSVVNYIADVYKDKETGKEIKAEFPVGMQDEVSYGPGVRAIAMFLNNYANVSIDKTIETIRNITSDQICPSKGWINALGRQFSILTEKERMETFAVLKEVHALHIDNTCCRVNGRNYHVTVCASGQYVLYFFRIHKGHSAVKGTPAEICHAVLIHDHDVTFFSYGVGHQECLAHVCRYLKDSIENEPGMIWNVAMLDLVRNMLHEAKQCDRHFTEERIREYEQQYKDILSGAAKEYESLGGPRKGYRAGYNLMQRMTEKAEAHLLFLKDPEVDPTNNVSETLLRSIKRKMRQVDTYRSIENLIMFCQAASFFSLTKRQGKSIFEAMLARYGDMYSENPGGMSNQEYKAWMEFKKRDLNILLAEERKLVDIDQKHTALENARRSLNGASRAVAGLVSAEKKDTDSFHMDIETCRHLIQEASRYVYITSNRKELLASAKNKLDAASQRLKNLDKSQKAADVLQKAEQALQGMEALLQPSSKAIEVKDNIVKEETRKLNSLSKTLEEAIEHERQGQIQQTQKYIELSKRRLDIAQRDLKEAQSWKSTIEGTMSEANKVMETVRSKLEDVTRYSAMRTEELQAVETAYAEAEKSKTRSAFGRTKDQHRASGTSA